MKLPFLTLLAVLLTCAGLPQKTATAAPPEPYRIGLGDVIEVQVWKEPELSRQVKVRLDGRISLPLLGDIQAAGRSPEEVAAAVSERLGKYITEPAVSVILMESASRRYYVIGMVNQPGEFSIDYPVTVLQALARAGGFQEWAKKDRIVIVRRIGEQERLLPFNYDAVIKGAGLGQNIVVSPGDTIVVP